MQIIRQHITGAFNWISMVAPCAQRISFHLPFVKRHAKPFLNLMENKARRH